jgi:DNA-binding SARP family transcriptional activator
VLIAYLACRQDWVRRDELAALFWPQHQAEAARSNLRKVLLMAVRIPGAEMLERQDDLLRWRPQTDLLEFEGACNEGRHADALAVYALGETGVHACITGYEIRYVANRGERV